MRQLLLAMAAVIGFASPFFEQPARAANQPPVPKAVYSPPPAYRPEWAKQGLSGKGVVLVTIEARGGKVTTARMLTSTGHKQLDDAAIAAYSQWCFKPGTGSQVKIPIEFTSGGKPPVAKGPLPKPLFLVGILGLGVAAMMVFKRRRKPTPMPSAEY